MICPDRRRVSYARFCTVVHDLSSVSRSLSSCTCRRCILRTPWAGVVAKFTRITVDPQQLGGVPCIRGLRIPVATVVGMVADRMTHDEILQAYPDLKPKDIDEALRYAAEAVRERELPLRSAS
jgi:uncharacterized protein (DUF433 family)